MQNNPRIVATGKSLPSRVVTNRELENFLDTSHEWIYSRTGIKERRVADVEVVTSDLAAEAAKETLEKAGVEPGEIGLIIVNTMTPDMLFPSTACLVQQKIGAKNAAAFDLEAACTGFLYGLVVGNQFALSGAYRYVLVIGAETMSKILDWEDRSTCVLFGDGAGALLLESEGCEDHGILSFDLGADGNKSDILKMPGGGVKNPATYETVEKRLHYLKMNGNEVYKSAVKHLGESTIKTLKKAGKDSSDVDLFIPHQANYRIIDSAMRKLNIGEEKVFLNVDKYGNMSAASIPVAFHEAILQGNIQRGDLLLFTGFGAGLTWGSCVLKW